MNLHSMFKAIQDYQVELGYDIEDMSPKQRIDYARECCLAMFMEVSEMTDSTPWKSWRQVSDQPMDLNNLEREMIDIIFFMSNICSCYGISSLDLEDRFYKVLQNNKKRIRSGYSKINKTKGENRDYT